MVVAIDGPAGSGKSTLARLLAGRLGFRFLDSGAMYRALTWKALREGVDPADEDALTTLLAGTGIVLKDAPGGQRTFVDEVDVSREIRGADVNSAVSQVAAHAKVRDGIVRLQRVYVGKVGGPGVVVEGRDIATVVFPDARVKFYLDATPKERARRRALQTGLAAKDELESIGKRDKQDTTRMTAPLRAALDAVLVDTTGRTVEEVLETLFAESRKRLDGA